MKGPSPPEYLIHTEWETAEMAQLGFAKVLVNHEIRQIYDKGLMAHLMKGPSSYPEVEQS